jgi:hypothetical protein
VKAQGALAARIPKKLEGIVRMHGKAHMRVFFLNAAAVRA